jgi:hypothetical protein
MRLLLATAAVLLVPVPAARAAQVIYTHTYGNKYTFTGDEVAFSGDGGEDDVTATIGPAGLDLVDTTAPLAVAPQLPGSPNACAPVDEHRVHCAIDQSIGVLRLDGNDGADRMTVVRAPGWTATSVTLFGEDGDDALTGSDGGELLEGGTGRDVLRGMGGDDTLRDGAPGGEVYDGGDGSDRLEITGRGLVADLAAGTVVDPATGATGTIAAVEGLTLAGGGTVLGTDGPDVLGGGGTLDGRGGDDRIQGAGNVPQVLRGGAGDDHVEYGPYDDVDGGPGDDVLASLALENAAPAHALRCGPGDDEVQSSTGDVPGSDCERIDGLYFVLRNDLRRVGRGAALRFSAVPQQRGCGTVAWADAPGDRGAVTTVARRRVALRAGVPVTATIPLRPAARRLIAAGRLRAPRLYLRLALRCPAHGRWTLGEAVGHSFGRRLAIDAAER